MQVRFLPPRQFFKIFYRVEVLGSTKIYDRLNSLISVFEQKMAGRQKAVLQKANLPPKHSRYREVSELVYVPYA